MNQRIAKLGWVIALLCVGWALVGCALRQKGVARTYQESSDLMTAAHGILLEDDEEVAGVGTGLSLSLPRTGRSASDAAEQILVRLINATKEQRNRLDAACRSAGEQLTSGAQACDRQLLERSCQSERDRLTARLSLLRKIRGDRRRVFTRFWHSVKRTGAEVWHRLGPTGRSFFRSLEKDVVQTVVTGGSLHGGVLRTLVIQRARTMARERLDVVGSRLLERIMLGGVAARVSAGEDCSQHVSEGEHPEAKPGSVAINPLDFLGDDCEGGEWLDDAWPDVMAQLREEGKACQQSAINTYRACLEAQAREGVCAIDAVDACRSVYDEIPQDIRSVSGVRGQPDYAWPVTEMEFSFGSGSASGSMHMETTGTIDECTYTIRVSLQGSYDPGTCSFRGTGTYSSTAAKGPNGFECILIADRGEILEAPITWTASLHGDKVSGTVNRPGGTVQFRVPLAGP